jgi:hypothetical protein
MNRSGQRHAAGRFHGASAAEQTVTRTSKGQETMKDQSQTATLTKQILLARTLPTYWRVTFNHPPLNIFGPETIPQLNEIVTALETDEQVKVVVFDSAVEGFFLTHYDFLAKPEGSTRLPARADGFATAARYARAPEPRPSGVDRVDSRTCDGCWKRACAGLRHAFREPRKSDLVSI